MDSGAVPRRSRNELRHLNAKIGLQFVGARGADAKALSAARDFERASQ
jgi:Asp-tRNA(Asn)/Glu-tRNA(Gln) amidotransferase A subunit family amidase